MKSGSSLYEILGVSPESEGVVIEAAYRALMRKYVGAAGNDPEIAGRLQRINAAYSTLGNARKRAIYDSGLTETQPEKASSTPAINTPVEPRQAEKADKPKTSSPQKPKVTASGAGDNSVATAPTSNGNFGPLLIGGLVLFAIIRSCDGSSNSTVAQTNGVTASDAFTSENLSEPDNMVTAPAEPVIPASISVDEDVAFTKASNCEASPALERAFKNILPLSETSEPRRPLPVKIGGVTLKADLKDIAKADDAVGTVSVESSVRLPKNATWHDLKISRLIASYYSPPETDSSYSRAITFRATPDELRTKLIELGFDPPSAGNYSELTDGVCGGSMTVSAIEGGSELRCSWGC